LTTESLIAFDWSLVWGWAPSLQCRQYRPSYSYSCHSVNQNDER